MKLNVTALANAAAATAAILWIVCSLFVVLLPGMMMSMTGHMVHLEMQAYSWVVTLYGFAFGLVIWVVLAWTTGWLFGTFYNRFRDGA
ncbi:MULTISPECIES: DUF5676 family membrane protein [Kordiimonas]|jgi:hypothetical protein|uniref:DUF5676 family membrane protein n=1 Tax=Kordiimonas TaxID=288021 RepID=UPI00257A6B11|nr:DUF5676 family membrane protein [Kordiimonas sp. UBA4487]